MKEEKKELYSYHHFLFPFRFDKIVQPFEDRHDFYKDYTFDERVNLEGLDKKLEKDGWEYQKFEVKNHLDYNELVYFYDFVKDSLFNTQDFCKNATSYYFEKRNITNKYIITLKADKTNPQTYTLDLTGITLRVFDTGVAILAFEIENHTYNDLKDIFNINEYGRRIYPQFLTENYNKEETYKAFLAFSLEVNGIKEEFDQTNYNEVKIANFIRHTLGSTFTTNKKEKSRYYIQPLLDDRMFVVSHILNNCFSDNIKNGYNDSWYEYVFLDKYGNKMVHNSTMQKELITKATYARWQEWGTLYGITRYSFVVLTDRGDFGKNVILNHVKTLYFQMVTLSLATRATILRFSDEITALSDIDTKNRDLTQKISHLYKNYLRFKNKLYFKEITPQEQGIELYDKIREMMRIDSDIADLSYEIASLNNYAFLIDEREEKEQMNKLTKLGTYLLPPSLVAGIFGMNVFGKNSIDIESVFGIGVAIIFGIVSVFVAKFFIDKKIFSFSISSFNKKTKNKK
ncbi:FIG00935632: hypothetical protein [hydrothermal vent metagenome]|uniref:Uncharacterized protein n=1 Tax=hydrothermal vent metagenome TaxID=652676 RepID=A0A1W1BES4_9ZZZZ